MKGHGSFVMIDWNNVSKCLSHPSVTCGDCSYIFSFYILQTPATEKRHHASEEQVVSRGVGLQALLLKLKRLLSF